MCKAFFHSRAQTLHHSHAALQSSNYCTTALQGDTLRVTQRAADMERWRTRGWLIASLRPEHSHKSPQRPRVHFLSGLHLHPKHAVTMSTGHLDAPRPRRTDSWQSAHSTRSRKSTSRDRHDHLEFGQERGLVTDPDDTKSSGKSFLGRSKSTKERPVYRAKIPTNTVKWSNLRQYLEIEFGSEAFCDVEMVSCTHSMCCRAPPDQWETDAWSGAPSWRYLLTRKAADHIE